jgi:purine-cytosine permease-like protein
MADIEQVITHGNEVFHIEVRGFDHIPEAERNMSLTQVDYLWVGTSVNLLSFALGALAITMGLSLWLGIVAAVVGNLIYAYISIGAATASMRCCHGSPRWPSRSSTPFSA